MENKSLLSENEHAFLAFPDGSFDTTHQNLDSDNSPSFSSAETPTDSHAEDSITNRSKTSESILDPGLAPAWQQHEEPRNSMNELHSPEKALDDPPFVSAEDVLFAMDTYLKVGISNEGTVFDEELIEKVEQGLGKIRLSPRGDTLLASWLQLVQSGARMQHGIMAEVEAFVGDYAEYLSNFDLAFGCLPGALPTWAAEPAPPPRSQSTRSEKGTAEASGDHDWNKEKQLFKKRRQNLKATQQEVLFTWLEANMDQPYPGKTEKDLLVAKTGMSKIQVDNWFINARRRYLPQMKAARDSGKRSIVKSFINEE